MVACGPSLAEKDPLSPLETTLDIDVETAAVATVRWSTDEPADAVVEYGADDAYGGSVAGWSSTDGLDHAVVLAGLAGGREWHWRASSEGDDGTRVSGDEIFVPASPPAALPDLVVQGEQEGLVLATLLGDGASIAVYDSDGQAVWWRILEQDHAFSNQARLTTDARAVVYLGSGFGEGDPDAYLIRVPIVGGEETRLNVGFAHHDFVMRGDGAYTLIRADKREVDGVVVQGDEIVEFDADGSMRVVWSTWDDVPLPSDVSLLSTIDGHVADWTHVNGLAWDGTRYWVSSYSMGALYVIDGATGELEWQLGGDLSDFELAEGEGFGPQHSPELVDGGVLLFNNRSPEVGGLWSEAAEFAIDTATHTYSRRWTFDDGQGVFTAAFGSVERLGDGDTFVGWGSAGRLSRVTAAGEVPWQADTPIGTAFGFVHHVATLCGTP